MIALPEGYTETKGVLRYPLPAHLEAGSKAYVGLRQREHRLYSDDEVARLPLASSGNPNRKEFQQRLHGLYRLQHFLNRNYPKGRMLELGCGNGWLASFLTEGSMREAVGMDINLPELEQAARVFGPEHVTWVQADIFSLAVSPASFDTIVLASAIQYFPDLKGLLNRLLPLLTTEGTLHIIDSPIYAPSLVEAAQNRSREYFQWMKAPEMAYRYFHHTFEALNGYRWSYGYRPGLLQRLVIRATGYRPSPFPWIIVTRESAYGH